jgi:hypothetical protein
VMMETLLGLVNEGMVQFAMVENPESTILAMLGMMPSAMPCERYSGSKPSMHIATVGLEGSLYVRPWSSNSDRDSANLVLVCACGAGWGGQGR